MSGTVPQTGDEMPQAPNRQGLHGGHTAVIAWLNPREELGYWITSALIVVFGLAALGANWRDIANGTRSIWWAIAIIAVFTTFATLVPLVLIRRIRAARRPFEDARRVALDERDPSRWQPGVAERVLSLALQESRIGASRVPLFCDVLASIQRRLAPYGIRPPGVILDARIAPDVLAIARPDDLLEPETIESQSMRGMWLLTLVGLPTAIVAAWMTRRHSILLGFVALAFGYGVLQRLLRLVRNGIGLPPSDPVAGVGYIEMADGTRILSSHALTLVSNDWNERLRVRLIAERGVITYTYTFTSAADPGFIAFWQRWNHPHPRPELLGDRATQGSI